VFEGANPAIRVLASRLKSEILKGEFARSAPELHVLLRYTQALLTQMAQTAVCNRHHALDQQLCRLEFPGFSGHDSGASDELIQSPRD
jgi:hypothetical protein